MYDSNLVQIDFNDDISDSHLFSAINNQLLEAGNYFVRIEEFEGNDAIANYDLSIHAEALSDDDDFLLLLIPSITAGANRR